MSEILANINLTPTAFKPDHDGYLVKQSKKIININIYRYVAKTMEKKIF